MFRLSLHREIAGIAIFISVISSDTRYSLQNSDQNLQIYSSGKKRYVLHQSPCFQSQVLFFVL